MKSNLRSMFEYADNVSKINTINDYDIFKDKELLDFLRTKIVENIIDANIADEKDLNAYINDEIDRTIDGYDLSSLERNHLFNLIDNEINGYGPLTELLKDNNITEIGRAHV